MSIEQLGSKLNRPQQVREVAFHMAMHAGIGRDGHSGHVDLREVMKGAEQLEEWLRKATDDAREMAIADVLEQIERVQYAVLRLERPSDELKVRMQDLTELAGGLR